MRVRSAISKCSPQTPGLKKKLWDIYTMEYSLTLKKKEMLPFATAWMDLENLMLSEMSQSEKDKYRMISLRWESNEQNELTRKMGADS